MIEILSEPSTLHFVGDRDYINGPTIFDVFCVALQKATGEYCASILVKKFMVNKTITNNGVIRVFLKSEQNCGGVKKRPLVEMTCVMNSQYYFVGLFEDGLEAVSERRESLEKNYVAEARCDKLFEGVCILKRIISPAVLIQALAETNRQIIFLSLPERSDTKPYKLKCAYCLDYLRLAELSPSDGRVAVKNLGILKHGDYCYILNSLELEMNQSASTFRMCFFYQDISAIHLSS